MNLFTTTRSFVRSVGLRAVLALAIIVSLFAVFPGAQPVYADQQYTVTAMSAQQQTTQVGTAFAEAPAVRVCVVMTFPCQPVGGVAVTFTGPASGASGTFATTGTNTVTITSSTTNPVGVATAPAFTANNTAGSYSVSATAAEPNPADAVPNFFFFTNSANAATKVALVSQGNGNLQATMINTALQTPFSVIVFDGANQFVPNVTVTFTAPSSGASGTFSDTGTNTTTAVTGATGVATAATFTANGTAGGPYFVNATVAGADTTTGQPMSVSFSARNTLTNVNGVPDVVSAAAGNGQNAPALTVYDTNLQVVVLDGSLAYVPGATVTFTAPGSGSSGTFPGGALTYTTTTGPTGLATAAAFTSNAIVGSFTVNVTATKDGVTATGVIGLSVGRVMTTTTVTMDPAGSSVYGQPIVISATVLPVEGAVVPGGPVTFELAGTAINTCTNVTPSGGVAICIMNWLAPGIYSFSADYLGDAASQPSSSSAVSYTVNKADTSVALQTTAPTFALEGDTVTFTATLTVDPPGDGDPTGGITFTSSDGTLLNGGNPVALVNGVAQVSTGTLPTGIHTITATYAGDSNFNGSNNALSQHIYTIPEVTDDPDSILVLVGETAIFTAAADGFPTPTVQWQVSTDNGANFVDIQGANTTTYQFVASPPDDQTQYRAVFTNPAGSDTTAAATLTVRQPPALTSADTTTFEVGIEGSFTVTATGILTPTLSLDGTLPDGVSFDAATGVLSGTPAVGTGGAYVLTITAANDVQPDAVQTFTLNVNEPPTITSADATTFEVGVASNFTVTASGYPAPTFSTADTLPAGVTLSPDGVISGTPTEHGVFVLTITATNGVSPDATQTFTLTVNEAPVITSADNVTFEVGTAGSLTVTSTGYPAPTISLSGALPNGVTFDQTTATLSGTPADGTGGTYVVTITATNGVTTDATQTFTLTVNEAPEFTSVNAATFVEIEPNSFDVTASGYPDVSFTFTGTLPAGVTLSSSGVLSGTPAAGTAGTYPIVITATNGVAPDATQNFTLTVVPPQVIAPDDITVPNDPNQAGAVVAYPDPTSVGNVGAITCVPPSGSFFPIGVTTVTCTPTNGLSDTFTITVLDNQPPTITTPANITINATGPAGAVVKYPMPTASDNAPGVKVACVPASGSLFKVGTTTVTCTATDTSGGTASSTFTVTVVGAGQLLDQLRGDTINLVSNTTVERALLATIDQARAAQASGNVFGVYSAMLKLIVQLDMYEDRGMVSLPAAQQLATLAREALNAAM